MSNFSFYARNRRKSAVFKNRSRKSHKKIASAPSQAFLGTDLKAAIGPDGFRIGVEIAKATGIGCWVE
ncbi:MAG: hypothetical protein OXI63_02210 [Candidatus Poribacteria bacterium]|nr:hypothetical protein [Candidatus Poribacteria bacterium]